MTSIARSSWLGRAMADADAVGDRYRVRHDGEIPHPSRVLQRLSRARHRLGGLYREMIERDGDLAGYMERRADGLLQLPMQIVGGADPRRAREAEDAADLCRYVLGETGIDDTPSRIADLHIVRRRSIQDARGEGCFFAELTWQTLDRGPWKGAFVPVAIRNRPLRRFAWYRTDNGPELRVRRRDGAVPAPYGKILTLRSGDADNPWGYGLLDVCYWPWFARNEGIKNFAHFVERFAMPTAVAEYDGTAENASDLQAKAQLLADSIQSKLGVAVPHGFILKYLEATRGGNAEYPAFLNYCGRQFALLWLGDVSTTGHRGSVGSYASDSVANDVRKEKDVSDAEMYETGWGRLCEWITAFNFGPDVAPPRVVIDTAEGEDRAQRMAELDAALNNGLAVPESQARQVWRARKPRPGEAVITRPRPTQETDHARPAA